MPPLQFTLQEATALRNIIEYVSKDLSLNDEPLLDVLYAKVNSFIADRTA